MNILFQSRKNLFSSPGGDTIQLLKTKEQLEKKGLKIDITTELEPDLTNHDLVHVFNLMRAQECNLQILNAKRQNRKVALSTIYGLYTEYDQKARGFLFRLFAKTLGKFEVERAKILIRSIKNDEYHKGAKKVILSGYKKTLKESVDLVDVFLPNSDSEMNRVTTDFGLNNPCYVSVPNAADFDIFDYSKTSGQGFEKYKNCVLSVARIEGRKCQLELAKALANTPHKLVLIGKTAPNHHKYLSQIKRVDNVDLTIIDGVEHDKLPNYYAAAKVHALVSWMETPGLSSIEAAAMNCNIVATKKGDPFDYFGDDAFYCEPNSISSIRSAVDKAFAAPISPLLRNRMKTEYNWEKAAEATIRGYELALGGSVTS